MLAILLNNMRLRRRHRLKCEKKKESLSCCRTCLSTEELHPIFYGKETEKKRSEELFLVTGTEIKINDGLPQKICSKCVEAMNDALQFRRTSEKARDTLSSLGYRTIRHTVITAKTNNIQINEPNSSANDFEDTFINDDFSYLNDNDDFITNNDITTARSEVKKKEDSPYICSICHKQFRMKNTYRAHMRFHTNYCVCELCGKKCRNNNLLTLHKRGRHGMERIHKCAYCEYSAANKEGLIIHERRHTGEKPYICDHCGASFHRRSNLIQHIAIHLPDKNFQCEQCHKRFHSKKFLQSHKFKMHQLRRYNYLCHVCKSHFTSTDSARKHLTRAHGVPREAQGPVYRVPNAAVALR